LSDIKHILIVDDEQDIGRIMKRALEREGKFEVDYFEDPLEALSNFKAGLYDLALVDIRMPKMDGVESASSCI
jgi:DNA-binding response OmpR family regulator